MRISLIKFPALFDLIYLLVTLVEFVVIMVAGTSKGFNEVLNTYGEISGKVMWVAGIGIVFHVIAYLGSLHDNWALFGNIMGIFGFLSLLILPKFFILGLLFLIISVIIVFRRNKHIKLFPEAK